MQTFPVSSSLLSAPHIAGFVHAAYGLKGHATARIIRSGINDTYRIDCGDERYVFRVYSLDWRTKTEMFEEIRLLEFLHGNGIAVSYPIRNNEGHYLNELPAPEGKRFAVLFSFAPGKKQGSLPEDVHRHTGETMARLHLLTENFALQRSTYTPDNLIREPLEELAAFLPAGTEELQYMYDLGDQLLGILASGTGSECVPPRLRIDPPADRRRTPHPAGTRTDVLFLLPRRAVQALRQLVERLPERRIPAPFHRCARQTLRGAARAVTPGNCPPFCPVLLSAFAIRR